MKLKEINNVTLTEYCLIISKQKKFIFLPQKDAKKINAQKEDVVKLSVGESVSTSLFIDAIVTDVLMVNDGPSALEKHPLWKSFVDSSTVSEEELLNIAKNNKKKVVVQFEDYLNEMGCIKGMQALKIEIIK